ncbi:heme ABC exporter ATP-binding protein CcmA [Acetobacteraceae bacterium ESL0709]|nr:heme ABC exporter ATP-binding protein CcmA [Acetobacteraceae bacterium ESL0697]MDF7677483.1 heme ABC exporter ATP-binding protein CcmA [Acetobacteraceae bacterium ESL0709]
MPPPLVELSSISVFRGERLVLKNISTHLEACQALLLTGPNGAGKSTLLRVIAGLCPVSSGTMERPCDVAWLGHLDALKPALTVRENLQFSLKLGQGTLKDCLASLSLTALADRPVRLLSAGQKRRVALARITLSKAPLWLLDEPSVGLDQASLEQLGTIMNTHLAQGGGIIATSHVPLPLGHHHTLKLQAPPVPAGVFL